MPKAHSYPYWGCGGCPWHRTSVCSARYFCNRLHRPVTSAIGCICLLQEQLWSTKMFSLCAETGCTKYFHLSLILFVQNFLCAHYKCNHAVASCRQSKDFLFCRGFTQSEVYEIFLTFDQGQKGNCKNLWMLVSRWFTFPDVAVLERLNSISNR